MRALSIAAFLFAALTGRAGTADAQTWASARSGPVLWQITSLDRTGELAWPYGAEDIAGDGLATFAADEAGADVRTVYAAADGARLWLRAYVAATTAPTPSMVAFFFIDTDGRADTGGAATGAPLEATLSGDPTAGGYERVLGVRGDGSGLGAWDWSAQQRAWLPLSPTPTGLRAEAGRARDPLALGAQEHGYVQVDVEHALSGLDASCGGSIFVRTRNLAPAPRAFGDDDRAAACRVPADLYGDPVILRSFVCHADAECPVNGRCRDGVCLFAYDCATAADCLAGSRCVDARCVRSLDRSCTTAAECSGLLCENGACVACTDVGQRTCAAGLACSPNGSCVDPTVFVPGPGGAEIGKVRGGAFSCSASSDAGSSWVAGLTVFLSCMLFRRRAKRSELALLSIALLFGVLAGFSRTAKAEDIDTQRFLPRATSGGFLQTEGSQVRYPVDPLSLGLWLSYGHNPLVRVDHGDVVEHIVRSQVGLDLTGSYAFARWFELGAHVPLAFLAGDGLSAAAVGDLRLLPKFRLLDDRRKPVGLAILADTRLPTHTNRFYGGARLPAFAPRLLLDHRFGLSGFRAGIDVGALIRKETEYRNVSAASELLAGIGLGYRFDGGRGPVELLLDLRSAVGLVKTHSEEVALEALAAVEVDVTPEWKLHAGGGLGLLEGFGVPTGRALLGVRWEPSPNDPDHDGVRSERRADDARGAGAVADEPQGADESTAESVDAVDDAAREAAIRGGYDACPDLPEDYDGIEDEDGCPEGDQDGDGVLDYLDRCPDEAETINGFEDDDGCKDEGPAQIVIEEGRITILETIRFEPNSSKLERGSYGVLDQITLSMRKNQHIQRIEIGGHTDSTGSHELNMRLSRERARSVRQYLIAKGIEPSRLSARGYGPDSPLADNESDAGRTKNRRVEFLVR